MRGTGRRNDGTTEIVRLDDEELGRFCELELEAIACLVGLGWGIDTHSLQAYMGTYCTGPPFTARGSLGNLSANDYKRATDECAAPAWVFER